MVQVEQLMNRRSEICFKLIEADSAEYNDLLVELEEIEQTIEEKTGKSAEEIERDNNRGDHNV